MKPIKHAPYGFDMILTDRCNFKCKHCVFGEMPRSKDISIEDVQLIMEKVTNPHLHIIHLFGGEPTLHRRFTDLVGTIKKYVNSNGMVIKPIPKEMKEMIKGVEKKLEKTRP